MERDAVVAAARAWIGTPYVHQASLRGVGADCLGLVLGVWRDVFGTAPALPRDYSPDWHTGQDGSRLEAAARELLAGCPEAGGAGPLPGAILLFRLRPHGPVRHLGIACGSGSVVHAASGIGVVESSLSASWRRRNVAAFDLPGVAGSR